MYTSPYATTPLPASIPVVIVGAGPTGLLTANLLGQYGIDTLLIDKKKALSSLPKAILLDDEGFRTLQAIGVADEVAEKSILGYGARYYNAEGECFASIDNLDSPYGYPRRNSFLQPHLETVLLNTLKGWESVTTSFHTHCVNVTQHQTHLTVEVEKYNGSRHTIIADYLLACDGGRSTIRSLLDIEMVGEKAQQEWLVIDTAHDPDQQRFTKFICDHRRPLVSIPSPQGGRRYELMLLPSDDRETIATLSSIQQLLAPLRPHLPPQDLIRSSVYTFHASVAEKFHLGRTFLLGDAAHLTPPFAGQGMNAGLRDSMNLSWKIASVIQKTASPTLLHSYEEERKKNNEEMIQFAQTLGEIVMPKTALDAKIVEKIGQRVTLIPSARDYISNMRFKPQSSCSSGFFHFSDYHSFTGTLLPQPHILLPDTSTVRLDTLLGTTFALIGIGAETLPALQKVLPAYMTPLLLLHPEEDLNEIPTSIKVASLTPEHLHNSFYAPLCQKGMLLLIRPDRYIYSEAPHHKIETLLIDFIVSYSHIKAPSPQPSPSLQVTPVSSSL